MRIEWTIEKQRGFDRPHVRYWTKYEDWERELRIPTFYMTSTIPHPFSEEIRINRIEMCDHDEHAARKRELCSDSQGGDFRLPFRQSGEYPEIAESMALLRDEIERRIIQAHDALALEITGTLEMTPATKKHVAAYAAAWKMTQAGKEY